MNINSIKGQINDFFYASLVESNELSMKNIKSREHREYWCRQMMSNQEVQKILAEAAQKVRVT